MAFTTQSRPSLSCTTSRSRHDQRTASTGPELPEHCLVQHLKGRPARRGRSEFGGQLGTGRAALRVPEGVPTAAEPLERQAHPLTTGQHPGGYGHPFPLLDFEQLALLGIAHERDVIGQSAGQLGEVCPHLRHELHEEHGDAGMPCTLVPTPFASTRCRSRSVSERSMSATPSTWHAIGVRCGAPGRAPQRTWHAIGVRLRSSWQSAAAATTSNSPARSSGPGLRSMRSSL